MAEGNNGYKMNFGAVDTAGGDLVRSAAGIENKLDEMERDLKPLQANWTGSASEAYLRAKASWTAALSEMKVLLGDIGRQVTQDSMDARSTEARNESRW
ncbi:WXG100 family type VII secretion target [Microbacterium soli]|uniref:ESAT-6-like protein n=1 Tax=Microbacterium soli TaxID=446075 RepID=A0ABP7MYH4_9MICO